MATATTVYGDDWTTTDLPYSGGGGGDSYDPMALVRQIADFQDERSRRAAALAGRRKAVGGGRSPNAAAMIRTRAGANTTGLRSPDDPNRSLRLAAERAALRAQMAEGNAVSQPAPMRMVNGPGIVPGYTMDVNRMSGAQRQIYLPQNSQQLPPDPRSLGRAERFHGLRAQREADRRGRNAWDEEASYQHNQATNPFNIRRLAMAGYGRPGGE